jgi:hypothetical protein
MRDIFLAYVEWMKDTALENHRAEMIVWAILEPHRKKRTKPPAIPKFLR